MGGKWDLHYLTMKEGIMMVSLWFAYLFLGLFIGYREGVKKGRRL